MKKRTTTLSFAVSLLGALAAIPATVSGLIAHRPYEGTSAAAAKEQLLRAVKRVLR